MELSRDERLRLLAEAREKARRDEADLMWGAHQEGMQQGVQQGRQEGQARVIALMREGYTPEQIESILHSEQSGQ
jgi:flagellar biosynthesis/type III secretory pathway protein FliH